MDKASRAVIECSAVQDNIVTITIGGEVLKTKIKRDYDAPGEQYKLLAIGETVPISAIQHARVTDVGFA